MSKERKTVEQTENMIEFEKVSRRIAEETTKTVMESIRSKLSVDPRTNHIQNSKKEIESISREATMEAEKRWRSLLQEELSAGRLPVFSQQRTVRDALNRFTREDLKELANDCGYHVKLEKKSEMVHKVSERLLEPKTMRGILLDFSEEELDVFEKAIHAKTLLLNESDQQAMRWFDNYGYAIVTENFASVCQDAAAAYQELVKNGFREEHLKMRWADQCLDCSDLIHGVAPIWVLDKMYRKCPDFEAKQGDFLTAFYAIPEFKRLYCMKEGLVFRTYLLEGEQYADLLKEQRDVTYYIPSSGEIEEYAENGFVQKQKEIQKAKNFFVESTGMDEEQALSICGMVVSMIRAGMPPSKCLSELEDQEISFNFQQKQKFVELFTDLNNHSRMWELKGHTPDEMISRELAGREKQSTIVPIVSLAAKTNKIYPNDLCPCGSGKKYKKCCGRNDGAK